MSLKVLGIGDNVADHYVDAGIIYPGGNAFNFAVYAKMLGADSAYLGVFGDDFPGRHVYGVAREMNIDLSRCRIFHGENGCPKVRLENGDRVFVSSNRGGVSRERPPVLDGKDMEYLTAFDLLHCSINSFMETELPVMASSGVPVSFDFSGFGTEMYFRAHCPHITCAVVSCGHMSEGETLALVESLHGWGSPFVIATRGDAGAFFSDEGCLHRYRARPVRAKDTMGAGDAFLTAFLLSWIEWLKTKKPEHGRKEAALRALEAGAAFAADICMTDGAFGHGARYPQAPHGARMRD